MIKSSANSKLAEKTSTPFLYPSKLAKTSIYPLTQLTSTGAVWYAVSGVNIVNGSKIQGDGKIETGALITEEVEVLLNINTLKDLEIAEKIMRKS